MSDMSAEMKVKRDELCPKHFASQFPEWDPATLECKWHHDDYNAGFNACHALMKKREDILVGALKEIKTERLNNKCFCPNPNKLAKGQVMHTCGTCIVNNALKQIGDGE